MLAALDLAGKDVVIVAGRRRVTGAGLAAQVRAEAAALSRAGVGPGTAVGFAGLPGPDTVAALMALRVRGRLRGAPRAVVLTRGQPGTDAGRRRAAHVGLRLGRGRRGAGSTRSPRAGASTCLGWATSPPTSPSSAHPGPLRRTGIPGLGRPLTAGLLDAGGAGAAARVGAVRPGDAVVIGTSGTTAAPRAVVHTETTLSATVDALGFLVDARPGQQVLAGTFFALLPALLAGAVVHLPSRSPRRLAAQLDAAAP